MTPISPTLAAVLISLTAAGSAHAQGRGVDCVTRADAAERLACYDSLHGRPNEPRADASRLTPTEPPESATANTADAAPPTGRLSSRLAVRWDLDGEQGALFTPRAYRPVYLMPVTWTDHVNRRPTSPAPDHSASADLDLRSVETKYQLSLKAKLGQDLFGTSVSLWGGYTQSSRWQTFNSSASRPFRETNYEPELLLVMPLKGEVLGWRMRMASLSLNHQSNGRTLPLSRSWNRVIAALAMERGEWVVEASPWTRIGEGKSDDNPDIENHIGRAELTLNRYWGNHALSLGMRHTLRGGDRSRGSAQVDWMFPMDGALRGYLQVFSGYGESLIDYNLRQTKLGLGVTIAGWR